MKIFPKMLNRFSESVFPNQSPFSLENNSKEAKKYGVKSNRNNWKMVNEVNKWLIMFVTYNLAVKDSYYFKILMVMKNL